MVGILGSSRRAPVQVNEGAIRLKEGLKKALVFGGIATAGVIGLGIATVGVKGGALLAGIDYAFGTGILKSVGIGGLAIVGAAAGAGFLYGATGADTKIAQAKAEARRAGMAAELGAESEEQSLASAADEQSRQNQIHRGNLIPPPMFGGFGGGGQGPTRFS